MRFSRISRQRSSRVSFRSWHDPHTSYGHDAMPINPPNVVEDAVGKTLAYLIAHIWWAAVIVTILGIAFFLRKR
ncbi:hypothetical protein KGP36_06330 [Patescibacteria group bacterium]|nr:hypothetical protein [Patescibacteria group bacterium]